jgi:hypothetical protein
MRYFDQMGSAGSKEEKTTQKSQPQNQPKAQTTTQTTQVKTTSQPKSDPNKVDQSGKLFVNRTRFTSQTCLPRSSSDIRHLHTMLSCATSVLVLRGLGSTSLVLLFSICILSLFLWLLMCHGHVSFLLTFFTT